MQRQQRRSAKEIGDVVDSVLRYNTELGKYINRARGQVLRTEYFVQYGGLIAPARFAAYKEMNWETYSWLSSNHLNAGLPQKNLERFNLETAHAPTREFSEWCERWGLSCGWIDSIVIWIVPGSNFAYVGGISCAEESGERGRRVRQANDLIRDSSFRGRVLAAYDCACALCSVEDEPLLEAAHIVPVSVCNDDNVTNGICLCALHHRAFDAGLIDILPSGDVVTRTEGDLLLPAPAKLRLPLDPQSRPSASRLSARLERNRHSGLEGIKRLQATLR